MATPSSPPPPYTPTPGSHEETPSFPDPPPYTPEDVNKQPVTTQPGFEHAQYVHYGTDGPKPECGEYPPVGVPLYAVPAGQPIHSSTTLLVQRERKPSSFFLLSIITCLCFSPLFGILAIVFSVMSDSAWSSGDQRAARQYSHAAVCLSVIGILATILTLICIFATGAIRLH